MRTFEVDDVEIIDANEVTAERVTADDLCKESFGGRVLGCSPGNFISESAASHPLVGAVGLAYNQHHPLSLSPDAVWMTIAQGMSTWITRNTEAVRKQFVDFEGKVKIVLEVPPEPDWDLTLAKFSGILQGYIGKKRDLFVADFSTTTIHERVASEVVLMYGMSGYFDYGMLTKCGFPRITLEGTPEDWEKIYDRVRAFGDLVTVASDAHMNRWMDAILPTLAAMYKSSKGNVNKEFWRSFYREGGGSGGPYVSGHVVNFFPYVLNYKSEWIENRYLGDIPKKGDRFSMHGLHPSDFDRGISKVDVEWIRYGMKLDVKFYGGLLGVSMAGDATLRPECGWAVVDATKDPK
jgi:hypothetical protein